MKAGTVWEGHFRFVRENSLCRSSLPVIGSKWSPRPRLLQFHHKFHSENTNADAGLGDPTGGLTNIPIMGWPGFPTPLYLSFQAFHSIHFCRLLNVMRSAFCDRKNKPTLLLRNKYVKFSWYLCLGRGDLREKMGAGCGKIWILYLRGE